MKLIERQLVEGTDPPVYIGKREYRDKQGVRKPTTTYFCEYCIHGQPVQRGLKTPSKQLAIRRVHEILSRIDRGEGQAVRARAEIPEIGRAYLEMQRGRNCAPTTYTKYKHGVVSWAAWAAVHFRRPAALFTEQHFWQWHQTLINDGYSEKTRYDRAILIKQVFKWAARVRLIPSNPLGACSLPEPTSTEQPCFTADQVARLITGADDHESAMYAVMAYAGLRFGEMRDLYWSAVAMPPDEPGFITVSRGGSNGTTKGRRTRRIPLHPELRKILEKLPRAGERIFYSRPSRKYPDGGHRVGESHLLKSLKRLCRRLGFAAPDQYKLHTFRHAFASMCAKTNVAYKYALEWMGHRSSEILDLYYTQFDDHAAAAIQTIQYVQRQPADGGGPTVSN